MDVSERLRGLAAVTIAQHSRNAYPIRQTRTPKLYANTYEYKPGTALRSTEVTGVKHARNNLVLTVQRKILLNLAPDRPPVELIHSQHILQHKRARLQLSKKTDELAIETIARVVDESIVIANLAVSLAGRATREQVEVVRR